MKLFGFSQVVPVAAALLLAAGCGGGSSSTSAPTSSGPLRTLAYSELASRLTDTRALADLSWPGAALASSYDRKGGNDDYNNPIRVTPDGWAVIADLKGPGYISRFWFTGAADGSYPLRFYFDDEKQPRIETTIGDFFGGKEPYVAPLAAYDPFCWYSFAPVPYQKRLVVMTRAATLKPDGSPTAKIYFHINYNATPAGTTVESFPKTLTSEITAALDAARAALAANAFDAPADMRAPLAAKGAVASGASLAAATSEGPAIVRDLKINADLSALPSDAARQQAMRELTLKIFWNDSAEPSVLVPLGDFFGSVWQRRQFGSFYFGLTGDTFYTRFPMPFEKSARIEVVNATGAQVPVSIEARCEKLAAWDSKWAYFHARWSKTTPEQVGSPHPFVEAVGRGRFAGVILSTMSLDRSWWMLEGDEFFSADGDTFPRWHGTGLEDYFNGGWYYGSAIVRPFNGLPYKAQFRTIQYRIQHTDPLDFQKTVSARIERGPDHASKGAMESVAFYYLTAPAPAGSVLGDVAFRMPPQDPLSGATVMTEINEFERLGDLRGAKEYIGSILERAQGYPYADVLRLRLLAYEADEKGFAAVAERIAQIAQTSASPIARRHAEDLKWFHEDPSHALLATYCNAKTQVFLDGNAVTVSGNPERFEFSRVKLAPGPHALSMRAQNRPYPFWCLAVLRTHKAGDIVTQADWKWAHPDTGDWAAATFDDSTWRAIGGAPLGKGPPEEPYIFLEPYAFPRLQAKSRGIWVPGDWASPSPTVVFRKNFTIP